MALRNLGRSFSFSRRKPAHSRRRLNYSAPCAAEVLESRLLLAATLALNPAVTVGGGYGAATTLFVDHNNPAAYQTIQAAVNAARPGSTILVAPGVYPETVTVSTKDLTIEGGQIHGWGESGPSIVESSNVAFTLEANDITLGRFTIEPPAGSIGTGGVQITAGSGDLMQNNLIESETVGIGVDITDTVAISSVTINGNTVEQGVTGIEVVVTATASLSGNTVENNQGNGIDVTDDTGAVIAQQNTVLDNTLGITVQCVTATLTGNVANGNPSEGISVQATTATLTGNTASDNGFGILVICQSVTFKNNTVNNNGGGVNLEASTSATVINNVMDNNNEGLGIQVQTESEIITGNTANSNGDVGFYLSEVGPGTISGNTANDNRGTGLNGGFFIAPNGGVKGLTVINNTADGNAGLGFWLFDLDQITFSQNTANGNGTDGINVYGSSNDTISHNTARGNLNDGIEADSGSTDDVFSYNTAFDNTLFDLQDESTGTGTDGTANTWLHNRATNTSL